MKDDWKEDGWREYQRLVLAELARHNAWLAALDRKLDEIRVEIAALKVRSGLWGAVAGLVAVAVMVGLKFLP
jgi:hypothetical protein